MPYAAALKHPMVQATLEIVARIKGLVRHEWGAALRREAQQLRTAWNAQDADQIMYGVRSHLKLITNHDCTRRGTDGCQCVLDVGHVGKPHRCACGKTWGMTGGRVKNVNTWKKYAHGTGRRRA